MFVSSFFVEILQGPAIIYKTLYSFFPCKTIMYSPFILVNFLTYLKLPLRFLYSEFHEA